MSFPTYSLQLKLIDLFKWTFQSIINQIINHLWNQQQFVLIIFKNAKKGQNTTTEYSRKLIILVDTPWAGFAVYCKVVFRRAGSKSKSVFKEKNGIWWVTGVTSKKMEDFFQTSQNMSTLHSIIWHLRVYSNWVNK